MRKRFFTVMAAALVVSGIPVMAKETSTEEKISEAVEETKDSTEAESVVSGNIDCRISGRKKIPEENAAGYSRYYRNITSQYCAF